MMINKHNNINSWCTKVGIPAIFSILIGLIISHNFTSIVSYAVFNMAPFWWWIPACSGAEFLFITSLCNTQSSTVRSVLICVVSPAVVNFLSLAGIELGLYFMDVYSSSSPLNGLSGYYFLTGSFTLACGVVSELARLSSDRGVPRGAPE